MTEQTVDNQFDMDSLLEGTLDDLADLPAFGAFPVGAHRAKISFEIKTGKDAVNGHPAIVANFEAIETVELPAGSEEKPVNPGDKSNVLFMMDNEFGQGAFKKLIAPLAEHFGTKTNRATMEAAEGAEVLITTTKRANKEDKTKFYMQVDGIQVL